MLADRLPNGSPAVRLDGMKTVDLMPERNVWRVTHPTNPDALRFMLRSAPADALWHHPDPACFEDLAPLSNSKDWQAKVRSVRSLCGLAGFGLADLTPVHANASCPECAQACARLCAR